MTIQGIDGINNNKGNIKPDLNKYATDCFTNSIYGNGFASNPISQNKTNKEKLYEQLAEIKDPWVRQQVEAGLMGTTSPSKAFIDELIKRYDKKQDQFEEAWAEYQAAKDNMAFYKKIMEITIKKYQNSESDFENGLVAKAEKNFADAELNSDILLSKASDIAHRVV